ncbi:MAG: 2-octaprenyl-6-methoxyphenyl hydroxylase [Alphaproteobacteria bacterium]|nr:2-octaprenyl-6-methoxyphenyl hydroxylase [Alphaproteobacteria bacterium]
MKHAADLSGDVLVVGGGLVGATLAIALGRAGLDVLVVEHLAPPSTVVPAFDGRVSSIAYASVRLLEALELWDAERLEAQPILDIIVSDGTVRGGAASPFLHFDHGEIGTPLGHLVENRHLRIAQHRALAALPTVHLLAPAALAEVRFGPHGVDAQLADGRQVSATLCIAADGRDSPLRRQVGIKSLGWSYPQSGIVTTVAHEKPHQAIAQQLFLPAGPFAILPMQGNRCSLVWTERAELTPTLMALDEERFTAELAARFTDFLGDVRPIGPRWSYPLRLHLARTLVASRFALAGDAAHAIHPIAGQGLNLGLRDVAALSEVLVDAMRLGLDLGAPDVLARYERWRRFDAAAMALATDAINALFSNDLPPLRAARDAGLGLVDRVAPLRRLFMGLAGGDVGEVPRLLKGAAL